MSNQPVYRKIVKLLFDEPSEQHVEPSAGRHYAQIHRRSSHIPDSLKIATVTPLEHHVAQAESEFALPTKTALPQSWW